MLPDFADYLRGDIKTLPVEGESLVFAGREVPLRAGILRFTPDKSYVTGNFSRLREEHAALQLDSRNGTTDRRDTLLKRTTWPPGFFKGKTVLECGCGAGPDTEILIKLGARVISVDLAGTDTARRNVGETTQNVFIQADIADLPFRPGIFDIVFCHRVIQHTPDPLKTLVHILRFAKEDGAVFVHSYARTFSQMFRWKYALRPFTRRMDPEQLYKIIKWYAPAAFHLTNVLRKVPLMKYPTSVLVPFLNYRRVSKFSALSDQTIIEYGIHDTFDALAPAYDRPLSAAQMRSVAAAFLQRPFEIEERAKTTLLRTRPWE